MERLNHTTSKWGVAGLVILLVCGGLVPAGFAAEGDTPLEAYFLPHDTELTGIIGAEYAADYYKVIVPATGRLIVRLYDINMNHTNDDLHLTLIRTTQNSTGTGYHTADYGLWPIAAQLILLGLMFVGGCAGSTTGSIKCVRIQLMLKRGYRELYRLVHPRAVSPIRLGQRTVTVDVLGGVVGFVVLYLAIFVAAVVAVGVAGLDLETAIASVAATLGTVGPGFGDVGPTESYAGLPAVVKAILSVCMLLGRLEIYAILLLFTPVYWRR